MAFTHHAKGHGRTWLVAIHQGIELLGGMNVVAIDSDNKITRSMATCIHVVGHGQGDSKRPNWRHGQDRNPSFDKMTMDWRRRICALKSGPITRATSNDAEHFNAFW